ncbi:MAG: hypothetical protein QOD26_209 [Betaproteobacteria bacterium]|jgi:hypothetical protein|nr:hypothetical protein [Betaproteobacteria bacterium]
MAEVRPFQERDLSEVAALFARVYPDGGWSSPAACAAYFQEMFFGNPWADASLPSWVARDGDRTVGFIGVVPRPMRLRSKPVRAAVLTQLMIDPQDKRYGLAAAQLLRAAVAGPQDLTLSDGANEASRRMWEANGGSILTLYGLQWRRLLRPARCALGMLPGMAGRAAAMVAAPMAIAADAYMTRRMGLGRKSALLELPLTATSLVNALETFGAGYSLRPRYDVPSLDWLLAQARAKRRHGELQAQLLRQGGRIAGWFLYYLNGGTSKVLQLAARPGAEESVLAHLFQHAWRRGAAAIEGRMEPRFARALSRQHCFFVVPSIFVAAHSRSSELLNALGAGDAFFSRLEGEWWMRFFGEANRQPGEATEGRRLPWARPRPQPAAP